MARTKASLNTRRDPSQILSKISLDGHLADQIRREAFRFGLSVDSYLREAVLAFHQRAVQGTSVVPPIPVAVKPRPPAVSLAGYCVALHAHGRAPIVDASAHASLRGVWEMARGPAEEEGRSVASVYMEWADSFLADPYADSPNDLMLAVHMGTLTRTRSPVSWTEAQILAAYERIKPSEAP